MPLGAGRFKDNVIDPYENLRWENLRLADPILNLHDVKPLTKEELDAVYRRGEPKYEFPDDAYFHNDPTGSLTASVASVASTPAPPLKKRRLQGMTLNGTGRHKFKKIIPSNHILDIRPHNHPMIKALAQNPISTTSNAEHAHAPIITCSAAFTPYDQNATNLHVQQTYRNQASGLRATPYAVPNSGVGKFLNANQARINPTHGFVPTQNQYIYQHAGLDHQGPNAPDFNRNRSSVSNNNNKDDAERETKKRMRQAMEYYRQGIKNPYNLTVNVQNNGGSRQEHTEDEKKMIINIALAGLFATGAITYAVFKGGTEFLHNVGNNFVGPLLQKIWEALQEAARLATLAMKKTGEGVSSVMNSLKERFNSSNFNEPSDGSVPNEGADAQNGNFEDGEMEGADGAAEPNPSAEGGVEGQGNPEAIDAGGAQGSEEVKQIEQAGASANAASGEGFEEGGIGNLANGEAMQSATAAEGIGDASDLAALEGSINAESKQLQLFKQFKSEVAKNFNVPEEMLDDIGLEELMPSNYGAVEEASEAAEFGELAEGAELLEGAAIANSATEFISTAFSGLLGGVGRFFLR